MSKNDTTGHVISTLRGGQGGSGYWNLKPVKFTFWRSQKNCSASGHLQHQHQYLPNVWFQNRMGIGPPSPLPLFWQDFPLNVGTWLWDWHALRRYQCSQALMVLACSLRSSSSQRCPVVQQGSGLAFVEALLHWIMRVPRWKSELFHSTENVSVRRLYSWVHATVIFECSGKNLTC